MPPKELPVTIECPNSVINPKVSRNSTISDLFGLIRNTILLRELWYFGLQYEDNNNLRYASLKKKISECDKSHSGQVKLRLRARFYPEDIYELIEDITRSYFYHEVKQQIISGQIYCSAETALVLASFQAVVRHHKYDPNVHKPGYIDVSKYIPAHILETHKLTMDEWEEKITHLHDKHGDMLEQDAVMEYLTIAQDLDMYGVTYFPIKNKSDTPLWLGVSSFGLSIYEHDNKLTGKINFQWGEIRRLGYYRSKFTVKPRDRAASNLRFYCDSTVMCKEILSTCTGNLKLFYRRQMPNDSIEVQQMKAHAKEVQMARKSERERLTAERTAREEAERRLLNIQHMLQEQESAFVRTQSALSDYQQKIQELEEQLEEERRARLELERMQRRLQEFNEKLERESIASSEERAMLVAERDRIMTQIGRQEELIQEQQAEKRRLEQMISETKHNNHVNGKPKDEHEVRLPEDLLITNDLRDARETTDMDYAKHMEIIRRDLDSSMVKDKLLPVDIQYQQNLRQGRDKFCTLREIRKGNTKQRVEQFECL